MIYNILRNTMAALLMTWALTACKDQSAKDAGAANYKTMIVQQADRTLKSEYTARLQGCQVVEVRPQVSGTITRICFSEGQKVRRGQTLFIIDQVPYKAALSQAVGNVSSAKAKLATAKLNFESITMLRQKNVVQDYDVSAARNEVNAAEAALQTALAEELTARNNLSYTEVKSPVDGMAGMISYRVGALVNSSIAKPLVTVSDDSRMYAYFSLTESQVISLVSRYGSMDLFISQMPQVELRMSNDSIYPHKGAIAAVSGIVTEGTGAVTLRADFPNNERLLPAEVTKSGVTVRKRQNSSLKALSLYSPDDSYDANFLTNYMKINIEPQMSRIAGVGEVNIWGASYSMRIWLDPLKMAQYGLMPTDISTVLAEQNVEAPTGTLGAESASTFQYVLKYRGRYEEESDYGNMVIKSLPTGEVLRLKDVATIELGAENYALLSQTNGFAKRTILHCKTATFALQNCHFWNAKLPLLERKTGSFRKRPKLLWNANSIQLDF